jgi:hypothetical protein
LHGLNFHLIFRPTQTMKNFSFKESSRPKHVQL